MSRKVHIKKEPSHGAPDGAGCMIGFRVYRNRAARSGIFSASSGAREPISSQQIQACPGRDQGGEMP